MDLTGRLGYFNRPGSDNKPVLVVKVITKGINSEKNLFLVLASRDGMWGYFQTKMMIKIAYFWARPYKITCLIYYFLENDENRHFCYMKLLKKLQVPSSAVVRKHELG